MGQGPRHGVHIKLREKWKERGQGSRHTDCVLHRVPSNETATITITVTLKQVLHPRHHYHPGPENAPWGAVLCITCAMQHPWASPTDSQFRPHPKSDQQKCLQPLSPGGRRAIGSR